MLLHVRNNNDSREKSNSNVVLVSMPFGPLHTPSIGLGLLSARLKEQGIPVKSVYFTVEFARLIDSEIYSSIAQGDPGNHLLLGEWLFRDTLFEPNGPDRDAEFLALFESPIAARSVSNKGRWKDFDTFEREVMAVRARTADFITHAARKILSHGPAIVGFTTVFQQHVASLATAAELKRLDSGVEIVFGGANVEATMGLETLRKFDQVDHVVSGEADISFPKLVKSLLRGRHPEIPGVYGRGSEHLPVNAPKVARLDELPYPDYHDYFEQLEECGLGVDPSRQRLLFESSRGCWWGEIQHCTFCGLNGTSMAFRSKSAKRALDELKSMTTTYPVQSVSVVDNIISMQYFQDFLPMLAESDLSLDLFYEVKANLKRGQVQLLKQANINTIQPGIESLSDSVLKLMRKGVSALQNIQLLKWCAEFEVAPHWNFIWGFPLEDPEAYEEMAALIPLIRHLPAPKSISSIRLDRFSPNFNEAASLGFGNVKPFEVYSHIYPFEDKSIFDLAYYFEFTYPDGQDIETYTAGFLEETRRWQSGETSYHFFSTQAGDHLMLWDFRGLGLKPLVALDPLQSQIYSFCETARTVHEICAGLPPDWGVPPERVEAELDTMLASKLMLRFGSKHLSLALTTRESAPQAEGLQAMQSFVQSLSTGDSDEVRIDLSAYQLTCDA